MVGRWEKWFLYHKNGHEDGGRQDSGESGRGENVTPKGGRHEKVGCVLGSSPDKRRTSSRREEVMRRRDPGLMMWISIWGGTGEPVLSIFSTGDVQETPSTKREGQEMPT